MVDREVQRDAFDRAVSLAARRRHAFLATACGNDLQLRAEIERLLAADAGIA